jgi:hypothetical protein
MLLPGGCGTFGLLFEDFSRTFRCLEFHPDPAFVLRMFSPLVLDPPATRLYDLRAHRCAFECASAPAHLRGDRAFMGTGIAKQLRRRQYVTRQFRTHGLADPSLREYGKARRDSLLDFAFPPFS